MFFYLVIKLTNLRELDIHRKNLCELDNQRNHDNHRLIEMTKEKIRTTICNANIYLKSIVLVFFIILYIKIHLTMNIFILITGINSLI